MLKIKNESEIAQILISGDIVDDEDGGLIDNWREGNSTGYEFPAKLKAQLDAVKDKALEVHINSYGGSVFAGVAMANFIRQHKPPTTCIVDGIAASIATQIFFAADVCKMPANAYLMLHKPFTSIEGNADDFRKAADILDTIQNGLEETYKPKLQDGISVDNLRELLNSGKWLTGTEAAEKFKIELLEPLKVVNCVGEKEKLKAAGIKNIPEPLNFLPEKDNKQDQKSFISDEEKLKIQFEFEKLKW